MTKDEALKLALEALKQIDEAMPFPIAKLAQAAIKEALANDTSQERVAKTSERVHEPVGWAEHGVINWLADRQFNHTSFLYDTPPQRTWVGLTDNEIEKMGLSNYIKVVRETEDKLKEKNT